MAESQSRDRVLGSIDAASRQAMIRSALTIRRTEERLLRLFSEGKLFGTVHTCIGQEFTGVAVAHALEPDDYVFSNHRCHGHYLARSDDVEGLVAEIMGKSTGVCAGLGGSQHLHAGRFFSNGIQGGIVPVATGLAFAQRLRRERGIAVVFVGDGTLGEGALHEALNIASKWELPLFVLLENNRYAQSTASEQTLAGSIPARFSALGIDCVRADTWNWEQLVEQVARSIEGVRSAGGPRCCVVDTDRLMAHSKGDDNRPPQEVAEYRRRDPLDRLLAEGGNAPWLEAMLAEIDERIRLAVEAAERAPFTTLPARPTPVPSGRWTARPFERQRAVEAVRDALAQALEHDPAVVLIGEDIESPYGGAFKATAGLSERFPGRVRNTPISEAAIVGVGSGLALAGYRPVVEIMFGDFLTLAADQWINHAAKFGPMYADRVRVPLVVRTPMGGRRGYGPTHSQSLAKHFLGVPDTQVLTLHHRYSPLQLYGALFATLDRPTLVLEDKILYGHPVDPTPPPGYELLFDESVFPTARLRPGAPADATVVAIGGVSLEAERAALSLFEEDELLVDLFLPTQLYPFHVSTLEESLARTRRLLVVEEGQGFVSLSSEILAQVAESRALEGVRVLRHTAAPRAIPAARPLEEQTLPGRASILAALRELCGG